MAEIDTSVTRYQAYRQSGESRYGVDVVNGAILLDLLTNGVGGNSSTSATAANQQLAIASLESLDLDNATEAQQLAIKNAVEAMQTALLADNASQTKQQEQIDLLSRLAPTAQAAIPGLTIVNNTTPNPIANTISGAKHISIIVKQGTGTVLGQAVDTEIAVIEYPFLERGWDDLPYTVNPGSIFVILTAS